MPDITQIRSDFLILDQQIHGKPLIYLDSAATSQKPQVVIDTLERYYRLDNANVHRGIHALAERATAAYEQARGKVARFINAASAEEVVFVRNTTEALNLVAQAWGRANLRPGDEVLITQMAHHANIVPWQLVTQATGATLRYVPLTDAGDLDFDALDSLLTERTKIFAFSAMSNVLGTINPVAELTARAHAVGALAVVDAAQSAPHAPTDVQAWDVDFLAFSGHKMLGPTGIGVLYGKRALLDAMPPFLGGGDMIREVFMERSTWADAPLKFEAGTPAIAEAIALGAAIDYLTAVGMDWVHAHERALVHYAYERLSAIEGLRIWGPGPERRGGLLAFTLAGVHPHDVAAVLDHQGIAVRAGHHCAQPVHDRYGLLATTRASFYLYNTQDEVDALAAGLERAKTLFTI